VLFHIFNSQEERRAFGGSAFIELQFCKLPFDTKIKKIIKTNSIKHWQNDSLYVYVDDIGTFDQEYSHIFNDGTYNNLKSGAVDIFGINYYKPSLTDSIIEELNKEKPMDYEALIAWLITSKSYNGFYILGI